MQRLTFSNVPTASGGIISGNISTGKGSPFGAGGQFEAQVANIKATIAKAPKGTYDPKFWDSFLQIDPEKIPEGFNFIPSNDPSIVNELNKIPAVQNALYQLSIPRGSNWSKTTQQQQVFALAKEQSHRDEIAVHVNRLMMIKNAPLINAIEKEQRQLEIDQAVKLALEQKIRETAKPKKETVFVAPPEIIENPLSYSPLMIAGVIVVIVLLLKKGRA